LSVVLINPPLSKSVAAGIYTPPLGLAYLVSSLNAEGMEAELIDAMAMRMTSDQVARLLAEKRPAVAGVTVMTPLADDAYRVLEKARPFAKHLVMGGPHPSALGPRVFEDCPVEVDAAVCGEAERTFPRLVRAFQQSGRESPGEIPGVLLPGEETSEPPWPRVEDLDELPFPARRNVNVHRHPLFGGRPVTAMITSRGCPYNCVFCDKHVCGNKWRTRSVKNVLDEMEHVALKCRVRRIIIYDDLFTLDRNRVIQICKGIVERNIEIRWKCEARVNRVDPEMLGWMKKAGCEIVAYGVETANEKSLGFLNKGINLEQVKLAFAMTRRAGLKTLGYFMLGIPGETMEDGIKTAELAIELEADYAQFGLISPFPGTDLYEYAMEKGWVKEIEARGPAELGRRRPAILDGYWTPARLEKMAAMAHRKFYFRPRYLVKRMAGAGGARELVAGAVQAARLAAWAAGSMIPGRRA